MDTGKKPQLGLEPVRESHLETLNDFASRMEVATKEAPSALTRAADDMAHSMTHMRRKHLYTQSETKCGSMGKTSPQLIQ